MGFKQSSGKAKIVTDFPSETVALSRLEQHMLSHWSLSPPISISAKSHTVLPLPLPSIQKTQLSSSLWCVKSVRRRSKKNAAALYESQGKDVFQQSLCTWKRSLINLAILQSLSLHRQHVPILEIRGFQQLRMWVSVSHSRHFQMVCGLTTNFRKQHCQDKCHMDIHKLARLYWWFW